MIKLEQNIVEQKDRLLPRSIREVPGLGYPEHQGAQAHLSRGSVGQEIPPADRESKRIPVRS